MRTIGKYKWGSKRLVSMSKEIPYLDLNGKDEPIDFLFMYKNEHGLIARGNIQTVKGREKTGKSAAGILLLSAIAKNGFADIKPTKDNFTVLWIDTEQDKNTLRKRAKEALKAPTGTNNNSIVRIVTLKGESPVNRLEITLQAIKDNKPDFVFLDGAVDLCEDSNDNKQSKSVVDALMKATDLYNCAILCVIHTNKKDDEARGHLGTILQQKSSEICEVRKNGDEAVIKQVCSRFADVPDIPFSFGDDFAILPTNGGSRDKRQLELLNLFGVVFNGNEDNRKHTELVKALCTIHGISESTAKRAIKDAVSLSIINKKNESYSYMFPSLESKDDEPNLSKEEFKI